MSDTVILDFLRVRFDRIESRLTAVDERLSELTTRIGILERSMADMHVQFAAHSLRMDRISNDLERVNRRLDLVEAE